ncbi:hypothetical protein NM208_g3742 [Fusarium decemcellulare]|uniref:Uncharacterized protein n=1 Tax=Fusarium decemcellulare TaxID=57161 RepID=A0ACC1SN66_9HYPO|nr:hypothetical protein NM208_g3742 [Fusarium decemcellulare]
MATVDWESLIQAKLDDRAGRIRPAWRLEKRITDQAYPNSTASAFELLAQTDILTKKERDITEKFSATTLISMLANKTISSVEVTTAFCKRAAIAQQLTNCLTEIFFEKALLRAKLCDDFLAREGKPMGPFHGLPISIKVGQLTLKSLNKSHHPGPIVRADEAATLGFVSYLTKPAATSNSVIVDILLDAGAVLYCKTNVPQTLFVCEGMNDVFGYTLNPHKLCLTPSGSSSGEGALVGFRGSILGVGTDIGGSIRAPSLCCGTFGFKPTANRLPYGGQQELIRKGWPGIVPALGPHAHSPQDLTLFVRSIIEAEPWRRDESALFAPWREIPEKQTLKIGLWAGDAEFPLHPPMQRALNSAAAALEAAGHQVKRVPTPVPLRRAAEIFVLSSRLDTKKSIFQFLADGNEAPIPALVEISQAINVEKKESSAEDIWEFNSQRSDFRSIWHRTWMENDIDVLLCPPSRTTAVPHGKYGVPWYTMIWNLLDCPAAVIPFLHADKTLDTQEMDGFDVDIVHSAPCSVQVVGWTGQDEEVLNAMEMIAKALENGSLSPGSRL